MTSIHSPKELLGPSMSDSGTHFAKPAPRETTPVSTTDMTAEEMIFWQDALEITKHREAQRAQMEVLLKEAV